MNSRKIVLFIAVVVVTLALGKIIPQLCTPANAAQQTGSVQDSSLLAFQAKLDAVTQERDALKAEQAKSQAQLFAAHQSNAKLQSTADYYATRWQAASSQLSRKESAFLADAWMTVAKTITLGGICLLAAWGLISKFANRPKKSKPAKVDQTTQPLGQR